MAAQLPGTAEFGKPTRRVVTELLILSFAAAMLGADSSPAKSGAVKQLSPAPRLPGAGQLATTALFDVAATADLITSYRNIEPTYTYEADFDCEFDWNGRHVRVAQVEHDEWALATYGDRLKQLIDTHDVIIPEYYPAEYASLQNHPIFGERVRFHNRRNAMFDNLGEYCDEQNKDVWVLDPSHSAKFGLWARLLPVSAHDIARFGAGYLTAKMLSGLVGIPEDQSKLLAGLAGGILTAGTHDVQLQYEMQENDLRRAFVARSLRRLLESDKLEAGSDVLFITPAGHWQPNNGRKGIEHYFWTPGENDKQCRMYERLVGRNNDILKARHYPDGTCNDGPQYEEIPVMTRGASL
jgi:hypothetical protein